MIDSFEQCDLKRIEKFFDSEEDQVDTALAEHLGVCEKCRTHFDRYAASKDSWDEATKMLQKGEFDQDSRIEMSFAISQVGIPSKSVSIQSVLDLLDPTDDPQHLGRIGGYEVSGVVGVGGMGVVLKAFDHSLDRVVAIKLMAPQLANNKKARQRFSREARAAAAVLHPNVISIHSVDETGKLPYLIMAYIRGESLQARLNQHGQLKLEEILRIGAQVAAGLAAAHEQGLVHRDIKPENILLEGGVERVTITDFGLARAVDDDSVTQLGTIAGTPRFMSPEQARGESVDQQSDLFSLGSVLYTMCTGRPPYQADTSLGVMRKIIDEVPVAIQALNSQIPNWLAVVVEKLMSKEKEQRFQSAAEVRSLLERCLSHVQEDGAASVPNEILDLVKPLASPKQLRLEWAVLGIAVLFGTFGVLGSWIYFGGASQKTADTTDLNSVTKTENALKPDEAVPETAPSAKNQASQPEIALGLNYDFSNVPGNTWKILGMRPDELFQDEGLKAFLEWAIFKGVCDEQFAQVLTIEISQDELQSPIHLFQVATTPAKEYVSSNLGVNDAQLNQRGRADGQPQFLTTNRKNLCVSIIDDRNFVCGEKDALIAYFKSLKEYSNKELELPLSTTVDGALFGVVDLTSQLAANELKNERTKSELGSFLFPGMVPFLKDCCYGTYSVTLRDVTSFQTTIYARQATGRNRITATLKSLVIFAANIVRSKDSLQRYNLSPENKAALESILTTAKVSNQGDLGSNLQVVCPGGPEQLWMLTDFFPNFYRFDLN